MKLPRRLTALSIALFPYAFASFASPKDLEINKFACFEHINEIYEAIYSRNGVVVNNFSLREERSLLSPSLDSIWFTASGANRTSNDVHLTIEFVVFDTKGNIAFAIVAQPMMSILNARKTENIDGSIYVPPRTLPTATKSCVRVVGDF